MTYGLLSSAAFALARCYGTYLRLKLEQVGVIRSCLYKGPRLTS
jgi:hypothetical protein